MIFSESSIRDDREDFQSPPAFRVFSLRCFRIALLVVQIPGNLGAQMTACRPGISSWDRDAIAIS